MKEKTPWPESVQEGIQCILGGAPAIERLGGMSGAAGPPPGGPRALTKPCAS